MVEKQKNFFQSVYEIVWKIPSGRVTSYGAIAKCLGTPKSSRMVGWAMNASHGIEGLPAHRVVNRKGILTGKFHFSNPAIMKDLLVQEGIQVDEDKVLNLNEVFWDPATELAKEFF